MVIVPISPIPPIAVIKAGLIHGKISVDGGENYVKQSIRNRYYIQSANGLLPLTMNVKGQDGAKVATSKIALDYDKPWVRTHLRAIESAYRSAPFFDHYFPIIENILETPQTNLGAFFQDTFPKWLKLLKVEIDWEFSSAYISESAEIDLRIHAKSPADFSDSLHPKPYIQVFSDRHDFMSNLSILDLLFNLGPQAAAHLMA